MKLSPRVFQTRYWICHFCRLRTRRLTTLAHRCNWLVASVCLDTFWHGWPAVLLGADQTWALPMQLYVKQPPLARIYLNLTPRTTAHFVPSRSGGISWLLFITFGQWHPLHVLWHLTLGTQAASWLWHMVEIREVCLTPHPPTQPSAPTLCGVMMGGTAARSWKMSDGYVFWKFSICDDRKEFCF